MKFRMKIGKKIICLILISTCIFTQYTYATFKIDKANLYSKGRCQSLLKNSATGGEIIVTKVFYKDGENEYPAYCMNVELGGVGEYGNYDVTITEAVNNPLVWRVITNGYPYQTFETLGVANEDEAYTATKQAVYCVLYDYDVNDFSKYIPIGEAGTRTLNAMKQIVNKARNSEETKPSNQIKLEEISQWKIDEQEKDFISKKIKISADCNIKEYDISLTDDKEKQIKISQLEQNEFKIMVPIKLLEKDDTIEINVTGELETKPILYGKPNITNYQNYALAGQIYEGGSGKIKVQYNKNTSKLKILKEDDENNKLEGVEFRILDEEKEIVYSNLTTNESGEIIIEGILPGKYYLEEVKSIDGYKKLEKMIEFEITINEELEITVTNEKEEIKTENNKKYSEKKLPITGM